MRDFKRLAKGALQLSEAFTQGRSELPKNYFNLKEARSGYLLYFTLTNFAKTFHCLKQAAPFLSTGGPLRILDVGAGPGTAALACSSFFSDRPLEIVCLEQNKGILEDAKNLFEKWKNPNHRTHFQCASFPTFVKGSFDLIIAANFLNELGNVGHQRRAAEMLLKHLNPNGLLIIIDPALQKTTRTLMALRDQLLSAKACIVLAPCLHQANCPMLAANQRDWCHFYIDWECPKIIRAVDKLIGNKHDYLKMAYLILQKEAPSPQPSPSRGEGVQPWRVVSSPLITKGKRELILCGGFGVLKKIRRLDKEAAHIHDDFNTLSRGDIVQAEATVTLLKKF